MVSLSSVIEFVSWSHHQDPSSTTHSLISLSTCKSQLVWSVLRTLRWMRKSASRSSLQVRWLTCKLTSITLLAKMTAASLSVTAWRSSKWTPKESLAMSPMRDKSRLWVQLLERRRACSCNSRSEINAESLVASAVSSTVTCMACSLNSCQSLAATRPTLCHTTWNSTSVTRVPSSAMTQRRDSTSSWFSHLLCLELLRSHHQCSKMLMETWWNSTKCLLFSHHHKSRS